MEENAQMAVRTSRGQEMLISVLSSFPASRSQDEPRLLWGQTRHLEVLPVCGPTVPQTLVSVPRGTVRGQRGMTPFHSCFHPLEVSCASRLKAARDLHTALPPRPTLLTQPPHAAACL